MFRPFSIDWMAFSSIPEVPEVSGTETDSYWMNVQFLPNWYNSVYMQWDIPEEWKGQDPTFSIFLSESEGGPYHQISKNRIKDPFYIVEFNEVPALTNSRDFFIIQTRLANGTTIKSSPMCMAGRMPRWQYKRWAEIIRREWILLDKFAGVDSVVFRKKDYGPRCKHCWDPVNEKIIKDNCKHCYGVSFENGYMEGIQTTVQYEITPDNRTLTYFGKMEQNQLIGWTIAYPTIKPHDIIIRLSDRKAFRVEALQGTEMLTNTVRQILQLNELPKSLVEHNLIHRDYWIPAKKRPLHIHGVGTYGPSVLLPATPAEVFVENDIDIEAPMVDDFNDPTYEELF